MFYYVNYPQNKSKQFFPNKCHGSTWSEVTLPITNKGRQPFIIIVINQLAALLPHWLGITSPFAGWTFCSFLPSKFYPSFKMQLKCHFFLKGVHKFPCWSTFLSPQHGPGTWPAQLIWHLMHIHYLCTHFSPTLGALGVNSFKGKVNFMYLCILLKFKYYAWHPWASSN